MTKCPEPWAANAGNTAATPRSTSRKFTSIIRLQSERVPSATGATGTPALATSASMRPKRSTQSAPSRARSSGCVTSTGHAAARPPPASMSATIFVRTSSRRTRSRPAQRLPPSRVGWSRAPVAGFANVRSDSAGEMGTRASLVIFAVSGWRYLRVTADGWNIPVVTGESRAPKPTLVRLEGRSPGQPGPGLVRSLP